MEYPFPPDHPPEHRINGAWPYKYIYTHIHIHVYIYMYYHQARASRAEAYRIKLWDYITELYYGTILRDHITG